MQVSERKRRELFKALETELGPEPAETLIEMLGPLTSDDPVARRSDIVAVKGDIAELRGEIAGVRGEIAELRGEVKSDIAAILPRLVAANVASMVGMAGLVLASANFL